MRNKRKKEHETSIPVRFSLQRVPNQTNAPDNKKKRKQLGNKHQKGSFIGAEAVD